MKIIVFVFFKANYFLEFFEGLHVLRIMGDCNTILCFQSDDMLVYEQQCYISIYHLLSQRHLNKKTLSILAMCGPKLPISVMWHFMKVFSIFAWYWVNNNGVQILKIYFSLILVCRCSISVWCTVYLSLIIGSVDMNSKEV
jgi:hypothetical protein